MLVRHILSLVLVAGLAGCRGGTDRTDDAPAPPANQPRAKDTQSGAASLYTMELELPELRADERPLRDIVDAYVGRQKQAFLASLNEPGASEMARQIPWDLDLHIAVAARTDRFVDIAIKGSAFTGGAHPAPIVDSILYDTATQQVVGLRDLFAEHDAAENAFATEARRHLLTALDDENDPLPSGADQIESGTAPGKDNFRVVHLLTGHDDKAHGLALVFPPYQVAAYVAGPQTVEVPATVFAAYLKPEYRGAFR